jgi:hypothetical protein
VNCRGVSCMGIRCATPRVPKNANRPRRQRANIVEPTRVRSPDCRPCRYVRRWRTGGPPLCLLERGSRRWRGPRRWPAQLLKRDHQLIGRAYDRGGDTPSTAVVLHRFGAWLGYTRVIYPAALKGTCIPVIVIALPCALTADGERRMRRGSRWRAVRGWWRSSSVGARSGRAGG